MINHPWLNMKANYEYKYTDREYEVMMLKKQLNEKSGKGKQTLDDSIHEMNELIESDLEQNAADDDSERESDEDEWYSEEDVSLWDSDEERT